MFEISLRTRYSETGQDGIIHHSSYVVYLEEARLEFFKSIGWDINQLEARKIFCPVVDLTVKYLKPLLSMQTIAIQISIGTFSKVRFSFEYQILREGIAVAQGTTLHCFTNSSFKPIPIPEEIMHVFKSLR